MQNYYLKLNEMIESHQVGASGLVVAGDSEILPTGTKFIVSETGEILAGNISKDMINVIIGNLLKSIQSKTPQSLTLFNLRPNNFYRPYLSTTTLNYFGRRTYCASPCQTGQAHGLSSYRS